jgi:hypothetical protein
MRRWKIWVLVALCVVLVAIVFWRPKLHLGGTQNEMMQREKPPAKSIAPVEGSNGLAGIQISILLLVMSSFGISTYLLIRVRRRADQLERTLTAALTNTGGDHRNALIELRQDVREQILKVATATTETRAAVSALKGELQAIRLDLPREKPKDRHEPAPDVKRPALPFAEPVEGYGGDDSIELTIRHLAAQCIEMPMTRTELRDRVQAGWTVETYGDGGERPDAFLIGTSGKADLWVLPNTRSWGKLRGKDWFKAVGPDLPNARIVRVDHVPRVRRAGRNVELAGGQLGQVETSIG